MVNRRTLSFTLVLALAGMLLLLQSTFVAAKGGPKILEFQTMVGVSGVFKGGTNAIRGVSGAGAAWTVAAAKGELTPDGHLEVKVTGLVFAEGPNIGSNTVTTFRGLVSCLNATGGTENFLTDPFPATTGPAASGGGNASIEANLAIPTPCIAPIVFVTSPGGSWFTVTGG
jgi:hypothetical protein